MCSKFCPLAVSLQELFLLKKSAPEVELSQLQDNFLLRERVRPCGITV